MKSETSYFTNVSTIRHEHKRNSNSRMRDDTIRTLTKNIILYGKVDNELDISLNSKSPSYMKMNLPSTTKAKMNDIYNELLPQSSRNLVKKSKVSSIMNNITRSNNTTRCYSHCKKEVGNDYLTNKRLNRVRSELSDLLGEEEISKRNKSRRELKDNERITIIKTEMNLVLNKEKTNRPRCIHIPIPIPLPIPKPNPSTDRYNNNINNALKKLDNKPDAFTFINDSPSSLIKYNKKPAKVNTDNMFQLKMHMTKL